MSPVGIVNAVRRARKAYLNSALVIAWGKQRGVWVDGLNGFARTPDTIPNQWWGSLCMDRSNRLAGLVARVFLSLLVAIVFVMGVSMPIGSIAATTEMPGAASAPGAAGATMAADGPAASNAGDKVPAFVAWRALVGLALLGLLLWLIERVSGARATRSLNASARAGAGKAADEANSRGRLVDEVKAWADADIEASPAPSAWSAGGIRPGAEGGVDLKEAGASGTSGASVPGGVLPPANSGAAAKGAQASDGSKSSADAGGIAPGATLAAPASSATVSPDLRTAPIAPATGPVGVTEGRVERAAANEPAGRLEGATRSSPAGETAPESTDVAGESAARSNASPTAGTRPAGTDPAISAAADRVGPVHVEPTDDTGAGTDPSSTPKVHDAKSLDATTQVAGAAAESAAAIGDEGLQAQERRSAEADRKAEADRASVFVSQPPLGLAATTASATLASAGGAAGLPPADSSTGERHADDLTKVEGIGPKISDLLQAAGISSFATLSEAPVQSLKQVLAKGGQHFAMHDPSTWPEQAALAARGDWDQLSALQDALQGGRRTDPHA